MIVQLILAAGSRAGTVASIHPGYYMIGRHRECQIRPKSRSVSRRHCVLFHGPDGARVFDLASTSGTKINDEAIPPREWAPLNDGDELRLGKVAFAVVVSDVSVEHPEVVGAAVGEDDVSMVRGGPMQESEIAAFLEAEDDADREVRYDTIRRRTHADEDAEDGLETYHDTPMEYDDEPSEKTPRSFNSNTTVAGHPGAVGRRESAPPISLGNGQAPGEAGPQQLPSALKRRLKSRSKSGLAPGGWRFDADQLKMLAAVVIVVLVVGYFIYQVYLLQVGPAPLLIDGLD